ncbi:unnamed protein product [Lymnaea stagnalis]|uniref:NAD-dependent epimerase/dehydratase domain-containing protein n=1 Tax=Lymnaea stagnalis TaxID=6523 RepID=A0AAV2I414_LYMST
MHKLCVYIARAMLSLVCLLFSLCPCLPLGRAMAVEVPFVPKQILIYGGNGFIGTSTAERLIEAGHNLTLINRGNWYWDSGFTVTPFVKLIKCDRMQAIDKCTELNDYITNTEQIDAVIDFSAYHSQSLVDTLDLVKGKVKLYIFISTDSVYDVCHKNHTEPSLETDSVRPISAEVREKLEAKESYGHRKLLCEETLATYRQEKNGPPYVILRLPDVVGPRDNTYRWWIYQLWMKLRPYLEKDVVIPSHLEKRPMSLVYVNDVADLIRNIVHGLFPAATDQIFNLAQKELITLKDFLEDMKKELNLTDVNIAVNNKPDTIRLFPSVHVGPVDTTKAEKILRWSPTKWETVLRLTCDYYEKAIKIVYFDRVRNDMIRTMQTYFTSKPYDVIRGLKAVYGLQYPEQRDEL